MSSGDRSRLGGAPVAVVVGEDNAAARGLAPRAPVVFALLVLATVAAFAWSQRLKRDPLVLDRVTFVAVRRNPDGRGPASPPTATAASTAIRIRFRVTQSDDGDVRWSSRAASSSSPSPATASSSATRFFTFYWDGRSATAASPPPGRYKLRVKLLGRTAPWSRRE